jgi:putative hemolysin
MAGLALQIAVIVVLTLLNGLFAMSETALVSSRNARLKERAEAGDRGARAALGLAESPNRFLSTVQIGISLIGVLAGAFGGATRAGPLADALRTVPALAPYARPLAFGAVVLAITYLSLIIGELVPKRLALNGPEAVASRVAGPMRLISAITAPAVWLLSVSTEIVLGLLGARRTGEPPVSEQEVEILMEEGAQAGVFEEERDLVRRALRLDDRPVRELMTPRPGVVWLDADDPPGEVLRRAREAGHSFYPVARGTSTTSWGSPPLRRRGPARRRAKIWTCWILCDVLPWCPKARRPPAPWRLSRDPACRWPW